MAYDAIGVLSMLASMNGSGSRDPELRRVCRKRGGVFWYLLPRFLVNYSYFYICLIEGERRWTSTNPRGVWIILYFLQWIVGQVR